MDDRLAADANLALGDLAIVSAAPGSTLGDTVVVAAITRRGADPSEVARGEYRVRFHLDHLQNLLDYGDRVDRFAVATHDSAGTGSALEAINRAAFGFRAHRSRDIAIETSRTFMVVGQFHRAIGVITIVASAIFLLCILLIKVGERRRDVAVMRSIGLSRRSVLFAIVLEAALISALGSGFGVLLGWGASASVNSYYQGIYRTPLLFAVITPNIVLLAVTISLVLGVVAGALAARRLVNAEPLELLGR
ncbi:MAG: ABC transporter permease [Gemmatimonadaceae bacterium]